MPVWVKICGIRDPRALQAAAAAGADAVGVVFAPSRRRVSPEAASRLLREAPPGLEKVGVFADQPAFRVEEIARRVGLETLQLHGSESPDYCRRLGTRYRVIKSIPVGGGGPLLAPGDYREADALLLDSGGRGKSGGSGQTFPWALARGYDFPVPVVLAGGLDAANVKRGLEIFQPWGVDVSSGVERAGAKDPELILEFVQTVRRWEREYQGTAR